MLGKTTQPSSNESSALAVNNIGASNDGNKPRKGGRPWCNHCERPGHTRNTCWNIHGKLVNWKPKSTSAEDTPSVEKRRSLGDQRQIFHSARNNLM